MWVWASLRMWAWVCMCECVCGVEAASGGGLLGIRYSSKGKGKLQDQHAGLLGRGVGGG